LERYQLSGARLFVQNQTFTTQKENGRKKSCVTNHDKGVGQLPTPFAGHCVINCYAMIYNKGSSWQMGRQYAQSSLFYGVLVRTGIRSFAPIFCFFSVFCIGSSIRGVDNTKKFPLFCSTNRLSGILFCSAQVSPVWTVFVLLFAASRRLEQRRLPQE